MLQTDTTKSEPLLLSIAKFAESVGLRPVTIRQWASRRRIASVHLGRRTLIPATEIKRLIEQNLIPALTDPLERR